MDNSKDNVPADLFREIGFNTEMRPGSCTEEIFFIKPRLMDDPPGGRRSTSATKEAVVEFITYWENQIAVARDYLKNDLNPRTHEWK